MSLVMSLVAFFVLYFYPLDVLDEIWDLIESRKENPQKLTQLSWFLRVFLPTLAVNKKNTVELDFSFNCI